MKLQITITGIMLKKFKAKRFFRFAYIVKTAYIKKI